MQGISTLLNIIKLEGKSSSRPPKIADPLGDPFLGEPGIWDLASWGFLALSREEWSRVGFPRKPGEGSSHFFQNGKLQKVYFGGGETLARS